MKIFTHTQKVTKNTQKVMEKGLYRENVCTEPLVASLIYSIYNYTVRNIIVCWSTICLRKGEKCLYGYVSAIYFHQSSEIITLLYF